MARASKKTQLIEFKGTTLPVVSVTLRSLHPEHLAQTARELFGDDAFFDGDAAVLELDQLDTAGETTPDWAAIRTILGAYGLNLIGVRGAEALRESAAAAGLPSLAAFKRTPRSGAEPEPAPVSEAPPPAPTAETPPAPAPLTTFTPTMIIDRPLRSGQQAYARGGDLVVLAAVNAGAEVIADGSIHVYGPLRGRAIAGAKGDTEARIFSTCMEPQLVSIAGTYRTTDTALPADVHGQPAQVRLSGDKLLVDALKL